jgi:hypothetical protein
MNIFQNYMNDVLLSLCSVVLFIANSQDHLPLGELKKLLKIVNIPLASKDARFGLMKNH